MPKICIIGAGPSGLAAGKNCLEQGLNDFVIFEKNNQLGGNWVFDTKGNHSSVYETTHLISSKRLSEYEDFPMPSEYPDYPSHSQLLKYFNDYADHFALHPYIHYNSLVEKALIQPDKKWLIRYQNAEGTFETLFDYLLIANGHHWDPLIPEYPGAFNGQILHAHAYKRASPFIDKRVLVVGGGNSACDIAVEIARIASKTGISMRKGQHIFPKFILGKPTDVAFRFVDWMPFGLKQRLAKIVIRLLQGRYPKYHLQKPRTLPLEEHPTINSELLYAIRHGKIAPFVGIDHFEGNEVYFKNGTAETFDTIIYATGYKTSFPFFDKDFLDFSSLTQIPLYRKMMHPTIESLYFIGLFQPQGCIWPLADHQAKIATRIIAGLLERPKDLPQKVDREIRAARKKFIESTRHSLEVDYPSFRKQLIKELR